MSEPLTALPGHGEMPVHKPSDGTLAKKHSDIPNDNCMVRCDDLVDNDRNNRDKCAIPTDISRFPLFASAKDKGSNSLSDQRAGKNPFDYNSGYLGRFSGLLLLGCAF